MSDLVERLNEKLKLKYIGNCKCGKCQLVEADLIAEAVSGLTRLRSEVERLTRERDEARELAQAFSQADKKPEWINRAQAAEAELTTLTARTREVLAKIVELKGQTLISMAHGKPYSIGANAAFEVAAEIANTLYNSIKETKK